MSQFHPDGYRLSPRRGRSIADACTHQVILDLVSRTHRTERVLRLTIERESVDRARRTTNRDQLSSYAPPLLATDEISRARERPSPGTDGDPAPS